MRQRNARGNAARLWLVAGSWLAFTACTGPLSDQAGRNHYRDWATHDAAPNLSGLADAEFIFRTKAIKDYEYGNYVATLRRATSWGEFGADSVKVVLDSLVAVTGGSATKSALGAASAGVTSATTSIKKNVLFDQSITTFITKMDALRLTKWNEILQKWRGKEGTPPSFAYTRAEAFGDLEEYGRCGTLDAALRDVDAKASAEKNKAQAANEQINKVRSIDDILKKKTTP